MFHNNRICAAAAVIMFILAASAASAIQLKADWIWANVQTKSPFQQVAFEKQFKLSSLPDKAYIYITADTIYRLRINGVFVMQGPARSSAGHATVDVINIRRYLKVGNNNLNCEAVYGDYVFEALAQAPGFLCEIHIDNSGKHMIIASDSSWKACELSAWNRNSPKFSFQRGWVEDIDGRKDIVSNWSAAVILGKIGMTPWKVVELRDVPLPGSLKNVRPIKIVSVVRGQNYVPQKTEKSISFAQETSVLPPDHWVCRLEKENVLADGSAASNPNSITKCGSGSAVLHGKNSQIVYDFGVNKVGFIGFEVTGQAGQVIEIAWNERLSANGNVPRPGEFDSSIMAMRYVLRGGKQDFLTFEPYLVRFIRVVNRSGSNIKLNSLYIKEYHFHHPKLGGFACSDSSLNTIYKAAERTATLNTLDTFMDCPSRERGAWLHDSYWTAQSIYAMFGDISVNRRMVRQIAESQDDPRHFGPDGMVHMLYPANIIYSEYIMPGHELYWVLQVGLDKQFTGDISYVKKMLPSIRRMFIAFDHICDSSGLIDIPLKWKGSSLSCWNFIDWADIRTDGANIGLNSIYVAALKNAAAMEREAGNRAKAEEYLNKAAHICKIINKYCLGDGYYPDTLLQNPDGSFTPSKESCESTQYYAIWSNVAPEDRARKIWMKLRDAFQPTPCRKVQPIDGLNRAGFFSFPERLNIAARFGDYSAFLRDIKEMYLPMAQSAPGTFWESPWADCSLCHGFSSCVGAMLIDKTLGIHIGLPIVISPRALGHLKWCKGYLTTPKGKIAVGWKVEPNKFTIRISIPNGERAQVILPDEAKNIWSLMKSKSKWHSTLTIYSDTKIIVAPGSVKYGADKYSK